MPVPVINTAYTFSVALADVSDPSSFKVSPTIAAGDFQTSLDGGAYANLATLPVVTPSGSVSVLVSLSADEMNGAKVNVLAKDVSGAEWQDLLMTIDIPTGSVESVHDIQEGDIVETSTGQTVNKKNTTTALLAKNITGSLLSPSVTITTKEV